MRSTGAEQKWKLQSHRGSSPSWKCLWPCITQRRPVMELHCVGRRAFQMHTQGPAQVDSLNFLALHKEPWSAKSKKQCLPVCPCWAGAAVQWHIESEGSFKLSAGTGHPAHHKNSSGALVEFGMLLPLLQYRWPCEVEKSLICPGKTHTDELFWPT